MHTKIGVPTFLLFTITFSSCVFQNKASENEFYFYVGTYTDGESEGIYRYQLQPNGTMVKIGLAARSENPSFLTKSYDGKYLLAVNENGDEKSNGGTITSFAVGDNELVFVDKKPSGGDYPCYVNIDSSGYILTANYGNGSVALLKLIDSGKLSGPLDILQHRGKGTDPRQEGPHAHSAWFESANDEIISVDLGTNELWFSKIDMDNSKLDSLSPQRLAMAPGSGPRHLTFHPNGKWIYVINELTSTVSQIARTSIGQYEILNTVSTLPSDFKGTNLCADIHVSSDGKFLYASNRGHNSIITYQIDHQVGSLTQVDHEAVHGDWPRNFTLSPDGSFLLVANQKSNNIVCFKRDISRGTLEYVSEIEAPSPVCLLF